MRRWIDIAGYQAVWFAAVIGAGRGSAVAGVLAALPFAAWHLATAPRPGRAALLALAGVGCGLLLDGTLARSGALGYAAPMVALDGLGAPAWILALWAVFALTLRCSLAPLQRRPLLALALGAVGGPLAYAGAARGWGAVTFPDEPAMTVAALAVGWALALPSLARLARWSDGPVRAATVVGKPA